MTTTQLRAVFNARRSAQESLKSLYDSAEGRDLSADEAAKEERLATEIQSLQTREANLLDLASNEARADAAYDASVVRGLNGSGSALADDDLRALHAGEVRSIETRDAVTLTAGTATDGAETVATTVLGEVIAKEVDRSDFAAVGSRIIQTPGGQDHVIPRATSYSAASIVAEGATIGEDSPQFDTLTLGAYKYAFLVPHSVELEADADFAVVRDFVIPQGVEALLRGFGTHWATGDGSGKPTGVNTATTGVTAAGTGAVTADELVDLFHSVKAAYRLNGSWLLNDATLASIRKLKDADNQYLWQPGLAAGTPDTLIGRPVVTATDLPTMAAGADAIVFGDFNRGSVVRWAGGIRVERSADFAFDEDVVTYRFVLRADADLLDTDALRVLTMAAS